SRSASGSPSAIAGSWRISATRTGRRITSRSWSTRSTPRSRTGIWAAWSVTSSDRHLVTSHGCATNERRSPGVNPGGLRRSASSEAISSGENLDETATDLQLGARLGPGARLYLLPGLFQLTGRGRDRRLGD